MSSHSYDTLSEAVNDLAKRGYVYNFNIACDAIECRDIALKLSPGEFEITEFYRFEGYSDPGDEEIVYAIESAQGVKGVLVNAYGVYADELSDELVQKLNIDRP